MNQGTAGDLVKPADATRQADRGVTGCAGATSRTGRHFASRRVGMKHGTSLVSRAYSECGLLTVTSVFVAYVTIPLTCKVVAMASIGLAPGAIAGGEVAELATASVLMGAMLSLACHDDRIRADARIRMPRPGLVSVLAICLLAAFPIARLVTIMGEAGNGNGMPVVGMACYVARTCYVGVMEELIFRGLLPPVFGRSMGGRQAGIASSVAFALAHVPVSLSGGLQGTMEIVPFAFLFGMVAHWVAGHCESIVPGMAIHSAYDAIGMLAAF